MTSILDLSVPDLLAFVTGLRKDVAYVHALVQLGVTDMDTIRYAARFRDSTLATIAAVATAREGLPPLVAPDDRTLVENIATVGADVAIYDFEHLDDWVAVAARYAEALPAFQKHPTADGNGHARRHTLHEIAAFAKAGWTPDFATQMIDAALEAGTAPDVHGYEGITPDALTTLVAAGISCRAELADYLDAGLTHDEALDAAQLGLSAVAVRAAVQTGLPRDRWQAILPGLPDNWFPAGGLVEPREQPANRMPGLPGITWEDIRFLADNGWEKVSTWDLHRGVTGYKHDWCGNFTAPNALRAAQNGITLADLESWIKVLYTGKGHTEWWERALPSITGTYRAYLPATIDRILQLREHGIRPSWIGDYRACGARDIDTAVRFAEAGITGSRAKQILQTFGERKYIHDPLRMRSADDTLRAHGDLAMAQANRKR